MDSQTRKIIQCESSEVGETSVKTKKYSSDSESSDNEETSSGSDPDAEKTSSNSKDDVVETSSDCESDAEDECSDAESEEGEEISNPPAWDYDVFLSFRGPDVRDDFIHYLYGDLIDSRIHTFMDDNEIRKGEDIGESLFKAIKHSKVFVPILSENYASSKWCLKELKCKVDDCNQEKHVILPVFYNVDPTDVRHQSGSYKEAMEQHITDGISKDVIQTWKNVLTKVGSMKGLVLNRDANGEKCKLKNLVIKTVEDLLKDPSVILADNVVGIENQVEEIMKLLDVEASDKRIVGLYGMGGIGKTTIVKFIYNKLLHEFQACSFLADVKELSKKQGLVGLQKQLIYDISKQSNTDFSIIDDGIKLIRERFRDKKVIIVLDDVGDKKEVDALIGGIEGFGAGSRVIITTRDKEVVNIPMGKSYEVKELDDGKSLKLFCRHAFKRGRPLSKSKGELASKIVATTGGLPLALEVIGSLLYKKNLEVWRVTFKQMKVSPPDKIQTTLRISYDDLDERQRVLFLDIACLFIGDYKQGVFPMWDACNLLPESNFSALVNKCLVRIDDDDRIRMHDQLRDFGRDLVRKENITQPGNWSRVWDMKDVLEVFRGYKDTCKAEAITCHTNFPEYESNYCNMFHDFRPVYTKLVLTNEEFANKSSLRYLRLRGADFDGDFNGLFPRLIWLCLESCHFRNTLTNFCPEKLVILELLCCDITENWNGWKILEMAVNLKILVIKHCINLRKSPKFMKNNALERLSLDGCENMVEIDASIKSLRHLIFLDLSGCKSLKKFPEELLSLEKLKALYIENSGIDFVPNSLEKLSALESFSICPIKLRRHWSQHKLPKFSIRNLSSLIKLPRFGFLRKLSKLELSDCNSLRKLPKSIRELRKLRELIIWNCRLEKLPSSVTSLKSLTVLQVNFTAIRKLPNSIGNLKNLKELNISYNYYLQGLPNSVWNLKKLETLDASRCEAMEVSIPDDIGNLINMRIMNLRGTRIQSTSTSICSLSNIQELDLRGAVLLKSLPDLPTNVQILRISWNLKTLDYQYVFDTRVDIITVFSGVDLEISNEDESLPFWSNLKSLKVESLPPLRSNLKSLKVESLPPLSSNLKSLKVKYCESLESLGDLSNLTNLSRLEVNQCPRIMEICGLNKLVSLTYLYLYDCSGLVTLGGLEYLALLRELMIIGCRSIEELPDLSHLKYLRRIWKCNYCKNFEIQAPEECSVKVTEFVQDFPEWQ